MPLSILLTALYLVLLAALGVWGLHRVSLLWRFRWPPAGAGEAPPVPPAAAAPHVTVQLPLFCERTVAARLVRAVGALEWPPERLEIQVLDDSTDETRAIVDREVAALREHGLDAVVVRREDRRGFKAGALDEGLRRAKGELFCIFDADFLPLPDFLRRTVPAFEDPTVGMVQTRWDHVNRADSALTRAQSTLLDGHFVIEHKVRADGGLFFNFNGTAGLWRRRAIEDAGGWQHDTLTEDLDLSYRAQLAGWRFRYLPLVAAPGEVPPDLSAFQSQQHRWAKGSVQVARKLGGRLWRADLPARIKLEAAAHLTGNSGHPLVLGLALLLPLAPRMESPFGRAGHLVLFLLCTASVVLFYDRCQRALGRTWRERLVDVPRAIALGIGMSVRQTRAVLEGALGGVGDFVRTPKRGDGGSAYHPVLRRLPGVELLLAAWMAWGVVDAARLGVWTLLPFLVLFGSGFTWVGAVSLADWLRLRRAAARAA